MAKLLHILTLQAWHDLTNCRSEAFLNAPAWDTGASTLADHWSTASHQEGATCSNNKSWWDRCTETSHTIWRVSRCSRPSSLLPAIAAGDCQPVYSPRRHPRHRLHAIVTLHLITVFLKIKVPVEWWVENARTTVCSGHEACQQNGEENQRRPHGVRLPQCMRSNLSMNIIESTQIILALRYLYYISQIHI